MARPPQLQKLRHGRLLCGRVFRFFVETWNWLVGAFDNLCGDWDVSPKTGFVTVDWSDPDKPVVRFRGDALMTYMKNSLGMYLAPGNFEPVFAADASDDDKVKLFDVGPGYCPVGRDFLDSVTLDNSAKIEEGFIYIEVGHQYISAGTITVTIKGAASAPSFANSDSSAGSQVLSRMPLYQIENGRITRDYRSAMSLTLRE